MRSHVEIKSRPIFAPSRTRGPSVRSPPLKTTDAMPIGYRIWLSRQVRPPNPLSPRNAKLSGGRSRLERLISSSIPSLPANPSPGLLDHVLFRNFLSAWRHMHCNAHLQASLPYYSFLPSTVSVHRRICPFTNLYFSVTAPCNCGGWFISLE